MLFELEIDMVGSCLLQFIFYIELQRHRSLNAEFGVFVEHIIYLEVGQLVHNCQV